MDRSRRPGGAGRGRHSRRPAPGIANADNTTGDHSLLGGEQIHIPIIAPIGLFGNHVNLLQRHSVSGGLPALAPSHGGNPRPPRAARRWTICGNAISSSQRHRHGRVQGPGHARRRESTLRRRRRRAPPGARRRARPRSHRRRACRGACRGRSDGTLHHADRCSGASRSALRSPLRHRPRRWLKAPAVVKAPAPSRRPGHLDERSGGGRSPLRRRDEHVRRGRIVSGNQVKAPVRIADPYLRQRRALGGVATAACEGTASSGVRRATARSVRSVRPACSAES